MLSLCATTHIALTSTSPATPGYARTRFGRALARCQFHFAIYIPADKSAAALPADEATTSTSYENRRFHRFRAAADADSAWMRRAILDTVIYARRSIDAAELLRPMRRFAARARIERLRISRSTQRSSTATAEGVIICAG